MKNIRPKKVTANSTTAPVVTPVSSASSGMNCSTRNGTDERRLTPSSAPRRTSCSMPPPPLPRLPTYQSVGMLDHSVGFAGIGRAPRSNALDRGSPAFRVANPASSAESCHGARGERGRCPPGGDGSVLVICHLRRSMRDLRQRRKDTNDRVEAEFWGRSDQERVKAWVATGIVLIGALAGIAGLTMLGRSFI